MSKPIYVCDDIVPKLKIGQVFELDNNQVWYYLGKGTGGCFRSDNCDWSVDKPYGEILKIWNSIKAYHSGEQPSWMKASMPKLTNGMVLFNGSMWYLLGSSDKTGKLTLTSLTTYPCVFEYDNAKDLSGGDRPWVTKIYASIDSWIQGEKYAANDSSSPTIYS